MKYADNLRARITELYRSIKNPADLKRLRLPTFSTIKNLPPRTPALRSFMASSESFATDAVPDGEEDSFDILDYVVNISYEKSELNFIHFDEIGAD